MGRLLGLVFAVLLACEVALGVVVLALMTTVIGALWDRNPWFCGLVVGVIVLSTVAFWRSRGARPNSELGSPHPGISISRIPITGGAGAVYMLQFVVWALFAPAVGLLYAALVAGGILLLPVVFYLNRRQVGGAVNVSAGAMLGLLCGLAFMGLALSRRFPFASFFSISVVAGVVAAGALIWHRRRSTHVSIAPFRP